MPGASVFQAARRHSLLVILSILSASPMVTHAAVVINEIAWMGSAENANDEWIELHNDGSSPVALDGWELTDNTSVVIELAGTVGAGEFALLERTDDASAPGSAFLIYTGALANDGRTLTLKHADGSIEDQVAGGESWENVGGDNVTKDTAQRTRSGWITSSPTPGAENNSAPSSREEEETSSQTESSDAKGPGESISLTLPDNELALSIIAPDIIYVNQPVTFDVDPHGIGEHLMDSLEYTWNFGDSYLESGKETIHSFAHPGNYIVIVEGSYARHSAYVRHKVTVLPVTFSITRSGQGDIQIHNTAAYEIDLSGFTLKGAEELVMPEHTILLPNSTLTISSDRLENGFPSMVGLFDPKRTLVASHAPIYADAKEYSPSIKTKPLASAPIEKDLARAEQATVTEPVQLAAVPVTEEATIPTGGGLAAVQSAANDTEEGGNNLPYLGLVGVIVGSIFALYAARGIK